MDTAQNNPDNLDALTIVVAEPQPETRGLHARALQAAGWKVLASSTMEDIHSHLSRQPVHALLFNLQMHPSQAVGSLKVIRRSWPQLSIITTGDIASEQQMDQLMQLGIAGHCHPQMLHGRGLARAVNSLLTLTLNR